MGHQRCEPPHRTIEDSFEGTSEWRAVYVIGDYKVFLLFPRRALVDARYSVLRRRWGRRRAPAKITVHRAWPDNDAFHWMNVIECQNWHLVQLVGGGMELGDLSAPPGEPTGLDEFINAGGFNSTSAINFGIVMADAVDGKNTITPAKNWVGLHHVSGAPEMEIMTAYYRCGFNDTETTDYNLSPTFRWEALPLTAFQPHLPRRLGLQRHYGATGIDPLRSVPGGVPRRDRRLGGHHLRCAYR